MYTYGKIITPEAPYHSLFSFMNSREISLKGLKVPKLMFTILNGGKTLGSKVKFSTFYLIIDVNGSDEVDANEIYFKITANIKKAIQAHKLGEAGFKANIQGSYFNAFDTVNDSFKLLEDAINQAQVNSSKRNYAQIGINADSQSSYLADTDKYDFEGPKNLFDQQMLTDYLFKMANDHPLLTYIEDPFAQGDIVGYQKIMNKFKETKMCISVKNWFGSDLNELQKHIALTFDKSESDEEAEEIKHEVQEEAKEGKEEKKEEVAPDKGAKVDPKAAAAAKGAKGPISPPGTKVGQAVVAELHNLDDPNCNKFRPNAIHFERTKHLTPVTMLDTISYI